MPLNWVLARPQRFHRIVLPVEHAIGAHQLEPAGKIAAVLVELGGKTPHHGFDHRLPLGGAHILSRGDIGSARTFLALRPRLLRRSSFGLGHGLSGEMRFVGGDLLLHHLAPGRIFRRLVEQRAPILDRRLRTVRPAPWRWRARCAARATSDRVPRARPSAARASSRHHPIIGEHQGLALPRQTLRRLSEQPDRLTVGVSRIVIAPPAHIDRGYRVPPLALLGVLSEPRLDAGDERFEILVARGILQARGERLVRQSGRAVSEIEAEREQRQRDAPTAIIAVLALATVA